MLVTQLIDLDTLGSSLEGDANLLADHQWDALAGDLAAIICPTTWRIWSADEADSAAGVDRYDLPNGYSLPVEARLTADLDRLIAELQMAVRRAKRDRWLAQVVALPA